MLMMIDDDRIDLQPGEEIKPRMVRFRYPWLLAADRRGNPAQTLPEIIEEMLVSTTSERQGALLTATRQAHGAFKKRQGYF